MRGIAVVLALIGCARDPEARLCPDVSTNDIAITEIRKGTEGDGQGSWVELYNASQHELDLRGAELRFRRKDGSGETDVVIRRSLPFSGGGYLVLGLFPDDMLPAHVNYGFAADFDTAFPSAVALDVEACGELVDRVSYDSLPAMGSYSLGAMPPSAASNDFPTMWCTDGTMMGTGYPGTPGATNHPCM